MFVIGITGGIGSGKSFVSKVLKEEFGAECIDTDSIAHLLMKKGEEAYTKIVQSFGDGILSSSLEIDRKKLREVVFRDPKKLKTLNSIVHPLVEEEVDRRLSRFRAEKIDLVCLETALLHEVGYEKKCDEVWFVSANQDERIRRLIANRGLTKEACEAIIKKQADEEAYRNDSDRMIENSSSEGETVRQIKQIIELIGGGKYAGTT